MTSKQSRLNPTALTTSIVTSTGTRICASSIGMLESMAPANSVGRRGNGEDFLRNSYISMMLTVRWARIFGSDVSYQMDRQTKHAQPY